MSWELPLLTFLLTLSVLAFWSLGSSSPRLLALLVAASAAALSAAPFLASHPRLQLLRSLVNADSLALHDLRPDVLLATHFRMALTLGAVVWLVHRSWQTIWKPVPELINILGVDVPEPPDVCLAGIRADAATLSWTRPLPNRPVQKYLIQVNGIHVGESPGNEIAITVTGLKPDHFYNIRVVAMGPNNFQAASQTVRLRTFSRDGKPYLGNARLPTNFVGDEQSKPRGADDDAAHGSATCSFAAVEAAPVLDGSHATRRDSAGTQTSQQRRNTVNRRHSPSVTSADQPPKQPLPDDSEASLDELSRRFQEIRKEINDTTALLATDETEYKQVEEELKKEKEAKRQSLKEKEEVTAGLKTQVRTTMEAMRAADKERERKKGQVKDKESKQNKIVDNITKLEKEIERMKKERGGYQAQKTSLEEKRDADVKELLDKITKLQEDHTQLETDLSNKGKMLNEMKEARQHLAGADDEHAKETDERTRREWEGLRGSLHHQLVEETKISHRLDQQYHALVEQFTLHQHQAGMAFYGAPDPTTSGVNAAATAAGIDPMSIDHVAMQSRRPSFGSADAVHMSPLDSQMATTDSPSQMPPPGLTRVGPASFAPLLFMPDNHEALSEDDLKSAGGLLSPSAQAYLPSGIIDNESDNNRAATKPPMLPDSVTAGEDDPQSPASSGRSYSVLSSPHSSSFKLSFPQYQDPTSNKNEQSTNHRLTSLLSGFQRSRKPDDGDGDGLPMGTLKSGQSQSFPRGTDEADITGASRRRISLSLKAHRNSTGLDGSPVQGFGTGTNASPSSRMMSRRLNPFASAAPGGNSMSSVFDRNADGSRPASIASMDMARPSTDSGSIWNAAGEGSGPSRLWPSGEGGWWGSRAGSRRPSNHGSPSMLTTTLASADDEILYETELNDAKTRPSHVGVIGSRPRAAKDTSGGGGESSSSLSQRLNPNAPTFMGLFRSSKNADKDKDKERERERAWERASNASVAGGDEDTTTHSFLQQQQAPRASVDAASTSMSMTESHDSLPLETSHSTDNVNGLRKLLRKGSASSKFSLFKKGPGSATTAASDRVASAEHRSRSSLGDVPDEVEGVLPYYEEATSASVAAAAQQQMQGKGYDGGSGGGSGSVTSSPALGRARSRESSHREGDRLWRFMKKRDKESLEMERE